MNENNLEDQVIGDEENNSNLTIDNIFPRMDLATYCMNQNTNMDQYDLKGIHVAGKVKVTEEQKHINGFYGNHKRLDDIIINDFYNQVVKKFPEAEAVIDYQVQLSSYGKDRKSHDVYFVADGTALILNKKEE